MKVYLILVISMLLSGIQLGSVEPDKKETPKIVLVLGSGGSKGVAHIGVIEELEKMGIIPDKIVGCSSGAIVGALYAQNRDIQSVKEKLLKLTSEDLIEYQIPFWKNSFSKRDKLQNFIKENLKAKNFSDLKIELITVATNFDTGKAEYFSEGSLEDALLASSSLPGLFAPYQIGDKMYIDGGCSDPLPVTYSLSKGEDVFVIASDVSSSLDGLGCEGLLGTLRKSFEIIYHNLSRENRDQADIMLHVNPPAGSPIEDKENGNFYQKGVEVVQNLAEEIRSKYPK